MADKLRVELKKHIKEKIPDNVDKIVKEGQAKIDQNPKLKIADEFGFRALEDFGKEDLMWNEKEEKKIKRLRK